MLISYNSIALQSTGSKLRWYLVAVNQASDNYKVTKLNTTSIGQSIKHELVVRHVWDVV